MFKKSAVLFLHFAASLRFTLSLQSAFHPELYLFIIYLNKFYHPVFYPWSVVCSPQSSFYTDRVLKGTIRFATQDDFQRNTQAGNIFKKIVLYNFCNIVHCFPLKNRRCISSVNNQ